MTDNYGRIADDLLRGAEALAEEIYGGREDKHKVYRIESM